MMRSTHSVLDCIRVSNKPQCSLGPVIALALFGNPVVGHFFYFPKTTTPLGNMLRGSRIVRATIPAGTLGGSRSSKNQNDRKPQKHQPRNTRLPSE
jgi:hypothetical protein